MTVDLASCAGRSTGSMIDKYFLGITVFHKICMNWGSPVYRVLFGVLLCVFSCRCF